eukprot:2829707-Rhodomonas_salina.1
MSGTDIRCVTYTLSGTGRRYETYARAAVVRRVRYRGRVHCYPMSGTGLRDNLRYVWHWCYSTASALATSCSVLSAGMLLRYIQY